MLLALEDDPGLVVSPATERTALVPRVPLEGAQTSQVEHVRTGEQHLWREECGVEG